HLAPRASGLLRDRHADAEAVRAQRREAGDLGARVRRRGRAGPGLATVTAPLPVEVRLLRGVRRAHEELAVRLEEDVALRRGERRRQGRLLVLGGLGDEQA